MMQQSENKPIGKTGSYIILVVCYLIFLLASNRIASSLIGWIIISLVTAVIFVLALTLSEFIKRKNISFLYQAIFAPIIIYAYFYFINLFLTLPTSYMIAYGSCIGCFTNITLTSRKKSKINKYSLIGAVLYYVLIGYITFRMSWKI